MKTFFYLFVTAILLLVGYNQIDVLINNNIDRQIKDVKNEIKILDDNRETYIDSVMTIWHKENQFNYQTDFKFNYQTDFKSDLAMKMQIQSIRIHLSSIETNRFLAELDYNDNVNYHFVVHELNKKIEILENKKR